MGLTEMMDAVVASLLPENPIYYKKSKFINDPLWGNIVVFPHELSILDTPLLQRLRYIRQTGFTYFTYPTATHSRFEHSIGVMNIATKIFNVLKIQNPSLSNQTQSRVRLATLLHDTGHSAFSHTSEEFYSNLEDIKHFQDSNPEYKSKGAGEIVSHLIVRSTPFKIFYEKVYDLYRGDLPSNIEEVANLIIGKPINSDLAFEADIVSGPLDADKLDYFPRDGRAAGIDVSIDIDRLINCLEIQETRFVRNAPRKSLVLNRRGYNALQQLLFARATLTASVYHHHKVRACDCMLKNILKYYLDNRLNFKQCKNNPEGIDLRFTPNYLLITDLDLKSEIDNFSTGEFVYEGLNGLFNRKLLKRVLKISLNTITTDGERGTQSKLDDIKSNLSQFQTLRKKPAELQKVLDAIIDESGSGLTSYDAAIDIPHKPSFEKAGIASINTSSNDTPNIVTLKQVVPIEEWVRGYETYFSHSYIFGPDDRELRIKLAIAAAKVLTAYPRFRGTSTDLYLNPCIEAVAEDIRDDVNKIIVESGLSLFRLNTS